MIDKLKLIIKEEIELTTKKNIIFPLSDDEIANLDNEKIMGILYKFRNKDIGDKLLKIINKFKILPNQLQKYNIPLEWFEKKDYKTFMQFFKRKLSKEKLLNINKNIYNNIFSFPCECVIESQDRFNTSLNYEKFGSYKIFTAINKRSEKKIFDNAPLLLKLKKPVQDIRNDLKRVGINNIDDLSFINMKLLKVFYHRIHAPIDCKVKNIIEISPENNLFGDNNLWIVELNNKIYGTVFMLIVGELTVQDFQFKINIGDNLKMFDEIGNFNWGSQIVLIYDQEKFKNNFSNIRINGKYFIGDKIF